MKTLLILYPYKFTRFEYFRFELSYYEEKNNYKVIIHDLSNILANKKLNNVWKDKSEKKAIKFFKLREWIHEFNKIKKTKDLLIFDHVQKDSFSAFIIELFLMSSNKPILRQDQKVAAEWVPKKNIKYFFEKIIQHKFNIKVYLFAIKSEFFDILIKCLKLKKLFLMTNKDLDAGSLKENISLIKSHSTDYSHSLLKKYKNSIEENKKNFIVYLDDGGPYFTGDAALSGTGTPENNTDIFYKELLSFFNKLETIFKTEILVIPHPKYRIPELKNKNLNPYFNNSFNDNSYDATAKSIPNSLFVISRGSTGVSHAIANLKPVQFIYSSNYKYVKNEYEDLFVQANLIGMRPINIAAINKADLFENLKVNKNKYDLYKFGFLTHKDINSEKPNHKIIQEIMDKSI